MMIVPFCRIACYGTVTTIFLIVTANMDYHIIVLITPDFVFQTSRFFSFLLSFLQFEFLCMSAVQGELWLENVQFSNCLIATSTRIFDLNSGLGLRLESSTGTHISVEVVMFLQLPNSYLIMFSIIQSFSVCSCNQN